MDNFRKNEELSRNIGACFVVQLVWGSRKKGPLYRVHKHIELMHKLDKLPKLN